jgi:hypothetical protein
MRYQPWQSATSHVNERSVFPVDSSIISASLDSNRRVIWPGGVGDAIVPIDDLRAGN